MPHTCLVMSGGGIYGYTMLGCLAYLYDNGVLDSIDTYIGTSMGAIIGYLLAIGYTPLDITMYLHKTRILSSLAEFDLASMSMGSGACDWNILQKGLEKLTLDKIGEFVNLGDLRTKYKKTLICSTYNMDTKAVEYIGPDTAPQIPALVAIRMSANVPFIFDLFKYQGSHYIDGGILDNLPIEHAMYKLGFSDSMETTDESKDRILCISVDYVSEQSPSDYSMVDMIYNVLLAPMMMMSKEKMRLSHRFSTLYKLRTRRDVKFFDFGVKPSIALDMFSDGYNDGRTGGRN